MGQERRHIPVKAKEAALARKSDLVTPEVQQTTPDTDCSDNLSQDRPHMGWVAGPVLAVGSTLAAIAIACSGKGETSNPPSESPTVGPSPTRTAEPTPSVTEAPTIVPTPRETPTASPQEKLYGPAPTQEELRSSLVAAFGGATYMYFDEDIEFCSDNNPKFNSETVSTEREAGLLLTTCLKPTDHLRSEGAGGVDAVNNGLDQLRNSYFGLVEKLVQRGLLSQGYLEPGQVEHTTELYFSHTK